MKLFRTFCHLSSLVCLLFLSACASATAVHEMSQGKKIAVTSIVGNETKLQWIGTTVFNNEIGVYKGYDLDQMVINAAITELRETKRYIEVASFTSEQGSECNNIPAGYDYLICFEQWTWSNSFVPGIEGIGVSRRTMFGSTGTTEGFISIGASVFDNQLSRIKGTAKIDLWDTGFQLGSGPQIPEASIAPFKTDMEKHIKMVVAQILSALGLSKTVEPNEWIRMVGLK